MLLGEGPALRFGQLPMAAYRQAQWMNQEKSRERTMYNKLTEINSRPAPFEFYSAPDLWTDDYISQRMLEYHLNESVDISSRNLKFIEASTGWIIKHFNLNTASKIIDFGCGPGLYTTRFARHGIQVTGIDFSKRSIEYAKQIARNEKFNIEYIHANYLEYHSGEQFDLITMIMCDFCALSPGQRQNMLGKFRKILLAGGSLLLDVYSLHSFARIDEKAVYKFNHLDHFWSPDDYYAFINTFKYDDKKVILDKYTIIENLRKRVIYNWLQYFTAESIKKEFAENGLKVVELYSDVAGSKFTEDSLEFAIVAVKD